MVLVCHVTWNLGHRTHEVPIRPEFYRAVELLRPDILVLNEFKDGPSRVDLRNMLCSLGLGEMLVSTSQVGHNQVLIASRSPIAPGDVLGPQSPDAHAATNFLHVHHPASGLNIVGMRAPAYTKGSDTAAYWRAIGSILHGAEQRRIVFAGDFNVDPLGQRSRVFSLFSDLVARGWQLPRAAGAWSFASGSRIDHVLASPSVRIAHCEYIRELGGIVLASQDRSQRISDHAALVAEVPVRFARTQGCDSLQEEAAPPLPYAPVGSQRWLQMAVAEFPDLIDAALVASGAIEPGEKVQWRSPIASTCFEEYRDGAALRLLDIERLPRRALQDFWPNGGPVWDALGVSSSGRLLLLEAKAHIAEAASPASRASPASLAKIDRALSQARAYYSPRAIAIWSGPLYQYANRLAFQYLLREVNGLDSRLVFLNFCNAPDVR
ncbi:MAG: hypothetical protein K0R58_4316, partial [Ramlibacter sp.]|nr:hypothetical protein [Ramlibacter sp.]